MHTWTGVHVSRADSDELHLEGHGRVRGRSGAIYSAVRYATLPLQVQQVCMYLRMYLLYVCMYVCMYD
jgi:hypothetical protein